MVILYWSIVLFLFVFTAGVVVLCLFQDSRLIDDSSLEKLMMRGRIVKILSFLNVFGKKKLSEKAARSFRHGLQDKASDPGSTAPKNKYPVELWNWETLHDEDVCEECQERASWPPMDIADWMKEGMPRTPEAETQCGENCRCQLVRYYPGVSSKKHHQKP